MITKSEIQDWLADLDEDEGFAPKTINNTLRVLQAGAFERIGSNTPIQVDVRIIAATNKPLEQAVAARHFREDLFYRLNVFPIEVPPLRTRCEDIPELAMFFIRQSSQRCKRHVTQIEDDALALLKGFAWPGNAAPRLHPAASGMVNAVGNVADDR